MTVYVCRDKDAACSEFPESLRCADCPTLRKANREKLYATPSPGAGGSVGAEPGKEPKND